MSRRSRGQTGAIRLVIGISLIVGGVGLVLLTCGLALSEEQLTSGSCCFIFVGGMIALGGIALLLPRGRPEDWDHGGAW